MNFSSIRNKSGFLLSGLAIIALFITSRFNFLLFHTIAQTYSIIIASWIFIISWNTRNTISEFFLLLGVTYFSVAIVRSFHQLTLPGISVFQGTDVDMSTQLWIVSRYLENLGIISAIIFCNRNVKLPGLIFITSATLSLILTILIMGFHLFPDCCINDTCITTFKLLSEYFFIAARLAATCMLFIRKNYIAAELRKLLVFSFVLSAAASACFTNCRNNSEVLCFLGHILEMISFYFIYKALLVTGIQDPFNTLLIHLKNNELELRRSRDDLETKVLKRTADLDFLNKNLQLEIEIRKMKEMELKKSEERMSLLLRSSRISITHFDKNLKPLPLFLNEKDPTLPQQNFYRLSLLPEWHQLDKMMRTVLENQKSIRDEIEFKIQKESLFFDVVIEPSFSENNSISGVFVIALDITEKLKIESVLKKKHQAIESIYTIATSFNYQKETVFEKISQSIAAILEVPIVSIGKTLNKKICDFNTYVKDKCIHSESVDCSLCKIMLSAKTACQISGNIKDLYPDAICLSDENFKTYLGVPVLSRTGEVNGTICLMDVRERKFTTDQVQLLEIFARYISNEFEKEMFVKELVQSKEMALLGQLTSGVAHEVRNPLNAIWAITEALFLDINGDDPNLIYKEHIHSQVKRLSRLMQDLLELGKPHVRNDRFSFSALCSETAKLWAQNNGGKTYTIHLDIHTENDQFLVLGDNIKMQQVLMNLFDNASEHSPDGSKISVQLKKIKPRYLHLYISDEGSGIRSEIKDRIFDPFFTTRKGGTGLGLSIVKHIVENHNGTIYLENNDPPPGITVKIQLPLSDDSNIDQSNN